MKVSFRQGIVTSQLDSNRLPTFLSNDNSDGYIALSINANSTIVHFSHGEYNYLYEEANTINQAWGPFEAPMRPCYWLYWDIDVSSGIRTFGSTSLEPVISNTKPSKVDKGLIWYNTNSHTVFEYDGYSWIEKIRAFAGTYSRNILAPYGIGTQVENNTENYAGFILFDDHDLPLVRSDSRKFLTTESQFYTTKSVIGTVKFDTNLFYASAVDNIPAYRVVSYYNDNKIAMASSSDTGMGAAVGLIRNEVYKSEVSAVVTNGYVTNTEWNFTEPPATPLYLGQYGLLQTSPPQTGFVQKVGIIVSRDTILVDIDPQIIYSTSSNNTLSPLSVDLLSGKLYTTELFPSGVLPGDVGTSDGTGPGTVPPPEPTTSNIIGLNCVQKIAKQKWIITHNLGSINVFVQVFDDIGDSVIPNNIRVVDTNTIEIYFNAPISGTAQVILLSSAEMIIIPDVNTATFEFEFPVQQKVWVLEHDIGHLPITRVYDTNGVQVTPYSIDHPSVNRTVITFVYPRSGFVRLI